MNAGTTPGESGNRGIGEFQRQRRREFAPANCACATDALFPIRISDSVESPQRLQPDIAQRDAAFRSHFTGIAAIEKPELRDSVFS